ncbi:CaiB/BaiF CoA transferase family protein [Propionibacteriaceae bacterium Y2011]
MTDVQPPLSGIRILDFTQMMAGPFATQLLADLGAEVIKIEKYGTGEWERALPSMGEFMHGQSPFFLAMNRGKKSIALDLKDPRAKDVVLDLARSADVAMNNFRPGAMERLGLGAVDLQAVRPDLICVGSSGFGANGPLAQNPGQDLLLQAMSGMAAQSGRADSEPQAMANSLVDAATALMNVIAVLSALLGRERRLPSDTAEKGAVVDVDMLSTAVAMQCQEIFAHVNLGQRWERSAEGVVAPWNEAPYGIYAVADGHIALAMSDLPALAEVVGGAELRDALEVLHPYHDRDAVKRLLQEAMRGDARDELLARLLETRGVWAAPVLDFEEVVGLEQLQASRAFQTLHHPAYGSIVTGSLPFRMTGAPARVLPPPMPGEHSRVLLAELGYDAATIDQLFADQVVSEWKPAPAAGGEQDG